MLTSKEIIAKRAAEELKLGSVINLGIGIPTLVTKFVNANDFYIHTENGLLGVKELENKDQFDPQIVNAGKFPIDEVVGASYFDSASSFAMIRGGHIDVAILGALQVDEQGYIANWAIPGKNILGVGGAMDLLVGAKKIIVTTNHLTKDGQSKILRKCTYPITSIRKIDMVITEYAVFKYVDNQLVLTEIMPGSTLEIIKKYTEAHFVISEKLKQN